MESGVIKFCTAVLERFFNQNTDTGNLSAGHLHKAGSAGSSFAVGKKIINNKNLIVFAYVISGKGEFIAGSFCKRSDICLEYLSVQNF